MTTPIEHAAEIIAAVTTEDRQGFGSCNLPALIAETLAAAGLIATEPQWGTEIPGAHVISWETEADARRMGKSVGHPVKVRYTAATSWKDADA